MARALLAAKGWREKSHECVSVALKALYKNEVAVDEADVLNELRFLRMKANYELDDFQESTARRAAELSEAFVSKAEAIIKKKTR